VKRRTRHATTVLAMALLAAASAGCLKRQFPVKQQYVLKVERPDATARERIDAVLAIARVRTAPQYERKGFVYRTGELTYTDDFYNAFYVPPAALVRTALYDWLSSSGAFRHVTDSTGLVRSDLTLEVRLDDFYVDLRRGISAEAIVRMTVTLVDSSLARPVVVFEKTYEESDPVDRDRPAGYAVAWGIALSRLLARVEADVASAAR
jgi:ABC-type uncharacterized transport system auxiliary subunit